MDWIAILALAIWVLVERTRTSRLERELKALQEAARLAAERRAAQPHFAATPPAAAAPTARMENAVDQAMAAALARVAATPPSAPPEVTPPGPTPSPMPPAAASPPLPPPPPPRAPVLTRSSMERWLAENGLAWIGGSALVIGGAFLVGFMAQHGWFTPLMRILAAALLGLMLLAVGEVVRRRPLAGFGRNRLAAAILSGAGAAVLYATTWSAGNLYNFIDGATCGALLAAIAWSMLGMAFLHGEALAVLALGGAFVAPLIVGGHAWSIEALTLYLAILIAAGAAVGWLRQWTAAAWANLAGAAVWSILAVVQDDSLKCLLIGLEPLVALAVLAYALPRPPRGGVGAGATAVASLAALAALWLAYGEARPWLPAALAAIILPIGVAALQRRRHAPDAALVGPGGALAYAVLVARLGGHHDLALTGLWCLQLTSLAAAGLWAFWGTERRVMSGVGALSALALSLVAGVWLAAGPMAAIAPAIACLVLALGALALASDRARPAEPLALDLWSGASAAALLAAIAFGLTWGWTTAGFALATMGLALLGRRLRWRAVSIGAAAAAGLGFAALLTPAALIHGTADGASAGFLLGCALALAAASFGAARIVAHDKSASEALRTISPLAALVGAFVFLRWVAGGRGGLPLDGLTEASLRTILIAAAGLASLARVGVETTAFARWRGYLLTFAAVLHALFFQALLYNPRFGLLGDLVGGVPVFDVLALAYLAPAAVFGAAALRIYRREPWMGRSLALAALFFGVLWAFLEIRRLTHGPHLSGGYQTISAAESVACSLVLLALAAAADRIKPRRDGSHPLRRDIGAIGTALRVLAVGFALWFAQVWSNPWWGPAAAPLGGWLAVVGVMTGYGVIIALTAWLALDARRDGRPRQSDALTVAAMLFGTVFAALLVRAGFHGPDLTAGTTAQLEIWSYSGVGAALGLIFIGVSRRGGAIFLRGGLALLLLTTGKVFIIDTASLSGVVRAGSFLALGVLLLLGALTARRIASAARPNPSEPVQRPTTASEV